MVVPLVVVMVVVVGLEGAMARQDDGLNYAELGKMDVMDGFGNLGDLPIYITMVSDCFLHLRQVSRRCW